MLQENKTENRINPFFAPYNTPHDTVPFDRIRLEDYEEAFMEGIRRDDEATDKIVNDPEEPTFENTLARVDTEKGEHYYDLLSRVSNVFSCMMSAETCDEMEALAQKMSPILTKHANDITLNKKLFERIKFVHDHPNRELNAEEQMLLDTSYDGFVRSGALLDEEGKEKLRQLTEEASMLTLQFSQNLLKENKAFQLHITDKAQLDGLPETAIAAAEQNAKEQEKEGWIFTLDFPVFSPFMTYSTQRELRKQMYMARNTECIHDNDANNLEICKRLINLRRELAQLLGFDTYADYVLKHRMASNIDNVYKLLNDLIDAYKPTAEKEVAEITALAKRIEGDDFVMEPWDMSFYSHKLQMEKYNLDAEMLRPYLQLDKVIDGVFGLAGKLYGITFKENKDIPVYHPDVKAYEVYDKDGSYLAVFYADFFPRKGKQGGAWMTEFQGQWIDHKGQNIRPHVSVVMNFTKPTAEKPALLTLGEVETFLHQWMVGLCGAAVAVHGELCCGERLPSHLRLPLSDRRASARRPDRAHREEPQLHGCLRMPAPGELRTARHGLLHQEGSFRRRHHPIREESLGKGHGHTTVAQYLYDRTVLAHHGRRLCCWLLQLQMGRGARRRCLQRVQEERYLRPADSTELQRQHPLKGWYRASDDTLQAIPRTRAYHRCPAGAQRDKEKYRIITTETWKSNFPNKRNSTCATCAWHASGQKTVTANADRWVHS